VALVFVKIFFSLSNSAENANFAQLEEGGECRYPSKTQLAMYAPISLDDFTQDSNMSARIMLGAQKRFLKKQQASDKIIIAPSFYLAVIPIVLLLIYFRRRLNRNFPKTLQIDSANYHQVRSAFDQLNFTVHQLQQIKNINPQQLPWIIRIILNQMRKLVGTLETSKDRIHNALTLLDEDFGHVSPPIFSQIKEADLWADRPVAYPYRY